MLRRGSEIKDTGEYKTGYLYLYVFVIALGGFNVGTIRCFYLFRVQSDRV